MRQTNLRAIKFTMSGAVRRKSGHETPGQARKPVSQPLAFPKTNRVMLQLAHAHRCSIAILPLRSSSFKAKRAERR